MATIQSVAGIFAARIQGAQRYRFLGQDFAQFGLSAAGKADALYFLRGEGYAPQMTLHRDTKRPNTARVSSTRGSH